MNKNSGANDFIHKLLGFSLGPFFSALIGFLTVPITTWLIDPSMLGKASMYTTAQSLITMFVFLGFDQSFLREYKEGHDRQILFNTSILVPLVVSIISAIVIIIFNDLFSILLFQEKDYLSITFLAAILPITVMKRFLLLIFRMEEKGRLYSLIQVLEKLVYLAFLLPLLIWWNRSYQAIIPSKLLNDFNDYCN
jgi:O-antigen/teichoic acid export membrane protein